MSACVGLIATCFATKRACIDSVVEFGVGDEGFYNQATTCDGANNGAASEPRETGSEVQTQGRLYILGQTALVELVVL